MENILLVEPDYQNKFPPLGLMKIGQYHKYKQDNIVFVKGFIKDRTAHWDRIYISTLFSFYHKKTIETILFYKDQVNGNNKRIFVGGVYASLYPDRIYNETGVFPVRGLLDKPGVLYKDNVIVDKLIPNYDLLKQTDYKYALGDSYFGYSTRGCTNKCVFCAVPKLEPEYIDDTDLKSYVNNIKKEYGEKKDLILFDNNILASKKLSHIIKSIRELGFERGAKFNGKLRYVDFNQGVEAAKINENTAKLLSTICIKPLRIAFDHISLKDTYINAVRTVAKHGILNLSNYLLYNFNDKPKDLYWRLRINIELNRKLGTKIYSFPMRYVPLDKTDRSYFGPFWTKKQIRGIQCIINVTKGIVGPQEDFFLKAFGRTEKDFEALILMPDLYILNRLKHENNGARDWLNTYLSLTDNQRSEFKECIADNDPSNILMAHSQTSSNKIKSLLAHYIESDRIFTNKRIIDEFDTNRIAQEV